MIIKAQRTQIYIFQVNPSHYPEGFKNSDFLRTEKNTAKQNPDIYFSSAQTEDIEVIELKYVPKPHGDTITFNLRGSE
jgi:hypothetical protein